MRATVLKRPDDIDNGIHLPGRPGNDYLSTSQYFAPAEIRNPAVLKIYERTVALLHGEKCIGTGIILGNHFLVTCSHVVVELMRRDKTWKGISAQSRTEKNNLLGSKIEIDDPELDFAVIRCPRLGKSTDLPCADPTEFLGDQCFFIGNPTISTFGCPPLPSDAGQIISSGNIQEFDDARIAVFGPTINPGFSGGPIIARNGACLGIISEQYRQGGRGPLMTAILGKILENYGV